MDNTETGKTYSAFERFLVFFVIPIGFTVILLGLMMHFLGYDVMNNVKKVAHDVPLIGKYVAAPTTETKSTGNDKTISKNQETTLKQFNDTIAQKDTQIKKVTAFLDLSSKSEKQLKEQVATLQEQLKSKEQTTEEYQKKIQSLADVYAKMTPNKAGPILNNLSTSELVLILSQMQQKDQVSILQSIDAKKAADASIQLKDVIPVKDREIAALQSRIKQLEKSSSNATNTFTIADLSQTFASMKPSSAASLIAQMMTTDQKKVLSLFKAMDAQTRSNILTAMSDSYGPMAASITEQLAK